MRGLSTTQGGAQGGGGINSFPNVAVYLDDQSAQLPSRNLDVYAADLERIEVLEGPQGTLYGAGAQAGAIRYITNKPKIDTTEGAVNASYSTTAHGDPSTQRRGAYQHSADPRHLGGPGGHLRRHARRLHPQHPRNLRALRHRHRDRLLFQAASVPPNSATVSNNDLVNRAYNPTTYQGARLSGLYKFNDDWNLLLQQSYQTLEADGSVRVCPFAWRFERSGIQPLQQQGPVREHGVDA